MAVAVAWPPETTVYPLAIFALDPFGNFAAKEDAITPGERFPSSPALYRYFPLTTLNYANV